MPACGKMNGHGLVVGQVRVNEAALRRWRRTPGRRRRAAASYSTSISSTACSAISGVSAATAATASPHVAHAIQREDAAILQVEAGVAGEVLAGHDHPHARQRPRLAHVDALDHPVRDRAALQRAPGAGSARTACRRRTSPRPSPSRALRCAAGWRRPRDVFAGEGEAACAGPGIRPRPSRSRASPARAAIFTASMMRI